MAYQISWAPTAQGNLHKAPTKVGHAVVEFVYGPLVENPQRVGKALRLDLAGLHSARRGDFRVIYRIDAASNRIEIVAIEHRSDAYRPVIGTARRSRAASPSASGPRPAA